MIAKYLDKTDPKGCRKLCYYKGREMAKTSELTVNELAEKLEKDNEYHEAYLRGFEKAREEGERKAI